MNESCQDSCTIPHGATARSGLDRGLGRWKIGRQEIFGRHEPFRSAVAAGESPMQNCNLELFMEKLRPWLDRQYVREVHVNDEGRLVMRFTDGTQDIYAIEDCGRERLRPILGDLKEKGILVTE